MYAEPDNAQPSSSAPADTDEILEDVEEEQDVPTRKRKAAVFDSDEEDEGEKEDAPVHLPDSTNIASHEHDMADIFGSDED